jgi:peptide chain release factor 2
MGTSKQLEALKQRLVEIRGVLKLDAVRVELGRLELQMSDPDFWSHPDSAKATSQKAAAMKAELESVLEVEMGLQELATTEELMTEDVSLEQERDELLKKMAQALDQLELKTLLSDEHDSGSAIVSLHAGAGGTDAQDWTEMLVRMFSRFIEKQGWTLNVLDESRGEEAGYKSISFEVTGHYAYGYLQSEAGVHRLVRISPFDAEAMRHTAFALVEVIPQLDAVNEASIEISPNDLRIDTYLSSGKGGQSVNTTYSAIRITHIPTNTVVTCQNERSQQQNRETAMRVLKSRLYQRLVKEQKEKIDELKGGHTSAEWGSQIRSYVLHPYKMVKDHRTQEETPHTDKVLDGDVMPFMEAFLRKKQTDRAVDTDLETT